MTSLTNAADDLPVIPDLPPLTDEPGGPDELAPGPGDDDSGPSLDEAPGTRLPQNLEAEQALLGGLLLTPEQYDIIDGRLDPEDFFSPANGMVFAAMMELRKRGDPLDPLLLRDELARRGELDRIGGALGLASLTGMAASGAHAEYYARVVREKSLLRRLISSTAEILKKATVDAEPTKDILDFAERSVLNVSERNIQRDAQHVDAVLRSMWHNYTRSAEAGQRNIMTGFTQLDEMLTGFHPGELIILAARPSVGKTTFGLNLLRNAVVKGGVGAAFFSIEMSSENIASHLMVAEARVQAQKIRHMAISHKERQMLLEATDRLSRARLWIDDTPSISLAELRGKARRLENKHQIRLVIVDYLQLMTASALAAKRGREQEVSEISRGLKALAKELRLPVVALAQLSRKPEGRQDGRPILSDLRESGAIEQDADVVMMLHRPENPETPDVNMELIVAKQRNGPTGPVSLLFKRDILRFETRAPNTDPSIGAPSPASASEAPSAEEDGF